MKPRSERTGLHTRRDGAHADAITRRGQSSAEPTQSRREMVGEGRRRLELLGLTVDCDLEVGARESEVGFDNAVVAGTQIRQRPRDIRPGMGPKGCRASRVGHLAPALLDRLGLRALVAGRCCGNSCHCGQTRNCQHCTARQGSQTLYGISIRLAARTDTPLRPDANFAQKEPHPSHKGPSVSDHEPSLSGSHNPLSPRRTRRPPSRPGDPQRARHTALPRFGPVHAACIIPRTS